MRIGPITVAEMREHAGSLLRAHWDEVAKLKHLMVLDPNWDAYEAMEQAGNLIAIALYAESGALVGYSVSMLAWHHNYAALRYCQNLVVFVDKEHRRQSAGTRLIKATEAEARARGAKLVLWHAKPDTALDALLRHSYAVQDVIYSKEL